MCIRDSINAEYGESRIKEMAGKPRVKSGFGEQPSSHRSTAPSFSIGTAPNHVTVPKEYISPEHEKSVNCGLHSPGPAVYESRSSLKGQVNSKKKTSAAFSFGTSSRFRNSSVGGGSPGPGAYSI
eukprot:TRINITY_DN12035_c0_g1_i1.p1 TRINITY_DN12035_c0_g1~~TRINITY_DN12035_c0_g1_i1.p1  ORF type:complete len:125 (-),score=31.59 TRINITY_DN12035_c0_g1_i1:101-475(-)